MTYQEAIDYKKNNKIDIQARIDYIVSILDFIGFTKKIPVKTTTLQRNNTEIHFKFNNGISYALHYTNIDHTSPIYDDNDYYKRLALNICFYVFQRDYKKLKGVKLFTNCNKDFFTHFPLINMVSEFFGNRFYKDFCLFSGLDTKDSLTAFNKLVKDYITQGKDPFQSFWETDEDIAY